LPLLIGLLLMPAGAWIGTVLFFTAMSAITFRLPLGGNEWLGALYIGTIVGSAFSSPVTVVALPAVYAALRRRQKLALRPLMITGAVAGFVAVAIVMCLFWGPQNLFADLGATALTLGIAADGAVTGAICGYLFGRITRRLEPDRWPVPRV
jgi:membrane associated rhomboid family serine protease